MLPWSPATGSSGSAHVTTTIVLFDPPVGIHSEPNVGSTFELGVFGDQEVAAKELPLVVDVSVRVLTV